MLSNIINFITSNLPLVFIILTSLFGVLARFAGWMKDQRAKRAAMQARAARQAEALRTGRPVEEPGGPPPEVIAAMQQAMQQQQLQEQRAQALRELQQKRLAELRARRGQQQGGPATPPPSMRPQQNPPRPANRGNPTYQNTQRAPEQVSNDPRRPYEAPRPAQRPRPVFQAPAPAPVAPVRPIADAYTIKPAQAAPSARTVDGLGRPSGEAVAGIVFGSRDDLRRAFIAAEVFGPPAALRDPDQPGSL